MGNLETFLMLALLVIVHELAHAVVAVKVLKMKPEVIAIGIPLSVKIKGRTYRNYISFQYKDWPPIAVSWLLLGGGVGLTNEAYYSGEKYWEKIFMVLYGPVANIAAAMVVAIVFFGPSGIDFVRSYIHAGLNLYQGYFGVAGAEIMAMARFTEATKLISTMHPLWIPVAWWVFWNVSVALFNLLPIPGMDGGQMLIITLIKVMGVGAIRPLRIINELGLGMLLVFTIGMIVWKFIPSF